MKALFNGITKFVTDAQNQITIIATLGLLICGILMMIPSEKVHEKVKGWIPFVMLGFAIAICATNLAASLKGYF